MDVVSSRHSIVHTVEIRRRIENITTPTTRRKIHNSTHSLTRHPSCSGLHGAAGQRRRWRTWRSHPAPWRGTRSSAPGSRTSNYMERVRTRARQGKREIGTYVFAHLRRWGRAGGGLRKRRLQVSKKNRYSLCCTAACASSFVPRSAYRICSSKVSYTACIPTTSQQRYRPVERHHTAIIQQIMGTKRHCAGATQPSVYGALPPSPRLLALP